MTGLEKISIATVGAAATGITAIDPSWPTMITAFFGAVVTITTLYFAFKTATLNAKIAAAEKKLETQDVKIADVIKTSDGMKDALVKATADASLAKGVLAGIAQAESTAAVKSAAWSEGRQGSQSGPLAQQTPLLQVPVQVPVLLPSQVQPMAAEGIEGVKLTYEQIDKMIQELQEQKEKLGPPGR